MKKIIIAVSAALTLLLIAALLFFRNTEFAYSGAVEAVEIDISPKLSDTITKFYVKEGDKISKGQTLFVLEGKEILAAFDFANKEFERTSQLYGKNVVSKEIYDAQKYKYDAASIKKEYLALKSPIDGKVLYKYYNEGEMAAAGRKVLTVADLKEMDVWVYLPHDMIAFLNVGDKVTGFLPEADKEFAGHIYIINDEAEFTPKNVQTRKERQRLVYGVKLRFANDENLTLKPGMTLEVKF